MAKQKDDTGAALARVEELRAVLYDAARPGRERVEAAGAAWDLLAALEDAGVARVEDLVGYEDSETLARIAFGGRLSLARDGRLPAWWPPLPAAPGFWSSIRAEATA